MSKKILFILHLPPPVHGSSMVGENIKKSKIINSNFDSKYINLTTSKTVDEIGNKPFIKIFRYIKILQDFFIVLIRFDPDLVYLAITAKGVGFYKDLPIALLAKLFRKKLVLHYHNKGVSSKQHLVFDNILYSFLFKRTKVILLSERLYKDVAKYVTKEDVFFCPNGIPVINFKEETSTNQNNVPQLLFLSNLIESKGVYVLLDALKILNDIKVKFHCNLVGGEGDISRNHLNQKISDLNLQENLTYLGKKYGEDKYEIFKSSDIFIFPTFYETFGLVNLEAMMFKLPVISTNEGGIPDIVKNDETGFIVDKQNPNQLAEKIKWLIDHPQDARLMGEKGQNYFLKHFTLEVFEKRMTHILNQI
jgi:glycosyltransferase involved in cell wall biosynthesis